jgi:hypothetical protein
MTVPTPKPAGGQFSHGIHALLHRHLLEQGHDVHDALAVAQHAGDRLGLRVDRADPGEVGHLRGDVQEAGDAAGGRGVEDDGIPHLRALAAAVARRAPDRLVDLAREQDVAHPGGDRRREVDDAHLLEGSAGAAELVEHL